MKIYYTTFKTEFGAFSLAVNDAGETIGTAFGALQDLQRRIPYVSTLQPDDIVSAPARVQVKEYLAGIRHDFDLPLAARGTSFQHEVWKFLRKIPRGGTCSYGEIALILGSSARAVGRANATNPISVIVPCHRVIGANGSLTGFAFGLEMKRRLLELENKQ